MSSSFPVQPLALPILPGANRPLLMEALHRPSRSVPGRTWVQLALRPDDEAAVGFLAGDMFALDAN